MFLNVLSLRKLNLVLLLLKLLTMSLKKLSIACSINLLILI